MTSRSLGRLNDQALAARSAIIAVPKRRIGVLIRARLISAIWSVAGVCQPTLRSAGGACVRYFRQNQDHASQRLGLKQWRFAPASASKSFISMPKRWRTDRLA